MKVYISNGLKSLVFSMAILLALSAQGAIRYVGQGQTYTTFAAAQSGCAPGDTISIETNVLTELITVSTNNLTIIGHGPGSTIVQATNAYGTAAARVFYVISAKRGTAVW